MNILNQVDLAGDGDGKGSVYSVSGPGESGLLGAPDGHRGVRGGVGGEGEVWVDGRSGEASTPRLAPLSLACCLSVGDRLVLGAPLSAPCFGT